VTHVEPGEYSGPLITLRAGGRVLRGTPHHIVPARIDPQPGTWFVYLMWRADCGWRVEVSTTNDGKRWTLGQAASHCEASALRTAIELDYGFDSRDRNEIPAKELLNDRLLHPEFAHRWPASDADHIELVMFGADDSHTVGALPAGPRTATP